MNRREFLVTAAVAGVAGRAWGEGRRGGVAFSAGASGFSY